MCNKCLKNSKKDGDCAPKLKHLYGWKSRLSAKLSASDGLLPVAESVELAAILQDGYSFLLIDDGSRVELVKASAFGTQVKIERGIGTTEPRDFPAGVCVKWILTEYGQCDDAEQSCSQPCDSVKTGCNTWCGHCCGGGEHQNMGVTRVIAPVEYRLSFNEASLMELVRVLKAVFAADCANSGSTSNDTSGSTSSGSNSGDSGSSSSGSTTTDNSSGTSSDSGTSSGSGSSGDTTTGGGASSDSSTSGSSDAGSGSSSSGSNSSPPTVSDSAGSSTTSGGSSGSTTGTGGSGIDEKELVMGG